MLAGISDVFGHALNDITWCVVVRAFIVHRTHSLRLSAAECGFEQADL